MFSIDGVRIIQSTPVHCMSNDSLYACLLSQKVFRIDLTDLTSSCAYVAHNPSLNLKILLVCYGHVKAKETDSVEEVTKLLHTGRCHTKKIFQAT